MRGRASSFIAGRSRSRATTPSGGGLRRVGALEGFAVQVAHLVAHLRALADPVLRTLDGVRGRETAKGVVASLPGVDDRDAAEALRGTEILVPRTALPPPGADEYYWVDLEGLRVVTLEGVELGTVSHLLATGANDVLVVKGDRERMLPFVQPQFVTAVDFDAGTITVDWDPDF